MAGLIRTNNKERKGIIDLEEWLLRKQEEADINNGRTPSISDIKEYGRITDLISSSNLLISDDTELCPDGHMFCANGGTCVRQSHLSTNSPQDESDLYFCDCNVGRLGSYAGIHCEHLVTEYCHNDEGANESKETKVSFCTNGGKCTTKNNHLNNVHSGCDCPWGFVGEFCQYKAIKRVRHLRTLLDIFHNKNFEVESSYDHSDMRISQGEAELCLVAMVTILVVFTVGLIAGTSVRHRRHRAGSLFLLTASKQIRQKSILILEEERPVALGRH